MYQGYIICPKVVSQSTDYKSVYTHFFGLMILGNFRILPKWYLHPPVILGFIVVLEWFAHLLSMKYWIYHWAVLTPCVIFLELSKYQF